MSVELTREQWNGALSVLRFYAKGGEGTHRACFVLTWLGEPLGSETELPFDPKEYPKVAALFVSEKEAQLMNEARLLRAEIRDLEQTRTTLERERDAALQQGNE